MVKTKYTGDGVAIYGALAQDANFVGAAVDHGRIQARWRRAIVERDGARLPNLRDGISAGRGAGPAVAVGARCRQRETQRSDNVAND